MVSFSQPLYLLLLLAVPPLIWWWLRQGRGSLRYPSTELLAGLPVGRARRARRVGAALRALGLGLLVVALAGPRWPEVGSRIPTEGIALVMLVDVSGSMAEEDFKWQGKQISRLDAVKRVFRLFVEGGDGPKGEKLEGRPGDLIGMVTFATLPETACPLTLSHGVLLRLLDEEKPRTVPTENRTNIGDAIAWGLQRLEGAGPRRKVLVLLTDGEHNVEKGLKPRQAAQLAGTLKVPIYVIDAAGDAPTPAEGAPEDASAADRVQAKKTLQEVAKITRGRYFEAHDTEKLVEACRDIDRLERQEITSFLYRRYHEGYVGFGLAALVLLAILQWLELTRWRRSP
jgi:Ca-activated chloride channel family protein